MTHRWRGGTREYDPSGWSMGRTRYTAGEPGQMSSKHLNATVRPRPRAAEISSYNLALQRASMICGAILAPRVSFPAVHPPCLSAKEDFDQLGYCQQIFDVLNVFLGQFFMHRTRPLHEGSCKAQNLTITNKWTTKNKHSYVRHNCCFF